MAEIIANTSNEPSYRSVANYISRAIIDHKYFPNEKLPTEVKLAKKMGLNRLTVSRGYNVLKEKGVIVQRQGRGTFVSPNAHRILKISPRRLLRNVALVVDAPNPEGIPETFRFIFHGITMGLSKILNSNQVNLCHFPVILI